MYVVSYSGWKFNALHAAWGADFITLPLLDIGRTIGVKSYSNRIKGTIILFCPVMNDAYDSVHGSCLHSVDRPFFIIFTQLE